MHYTVKHCLAAQVSLLTVLCITLTGTGSGDSYADMLSARSIRSADLSGLSTVPVPDGPFGRTAVRLQQRLRKHSGSSPPVDDLAVALEERSKLLKATVDVSVYSADNPELGKWTASVPAHPLWIEPRFSMQEASYSISSDRIADTLEREQTGAFPYAVNVDINSIEIDASGVLRAQTNTVGKPGYQMDIPIVSETIANALSNGSPSIEIGVTNVNATIANNSGVNLGSMVLLASGKSNYKGSDWNRQHNVRKGLEQHVNNIIVPPGETFSFNETLGGKVSVQNGWAMAKVIVNGGDLELQPGGGICQASTTAFRAILDAGFPITERRSHSLYVGYYEEYGVGIDATIYPGTQDLEFVNDTGNYLLLQAYVTDDYDAIVNIYGTPDGRSVALEGPFFTANAPEGFTHNGRALQRNEIAWVQHVTFADGRTESNVYVSRYKYIPKSIVAKYTTQQVHAAAN